MSSKHAGSEGSAGAQVKILITLTWRAHSGAGTKPRNLYAATPQVPPMALPLPLPLHACPPAQDFDMQRAWA